VLLVREIVPARYQLVDGQLRAETVPDSHVPGRGAGPGRHPGARAWAMADEYVTQATYARMRRVSRMAVNRRTMTLGGPVPVYGPKKLIRVAEANALWDATMVAKAASAQPAAVSVGTTRCDWTGTCRRRHHLDGGRSRADRVVMKLARSSRVTSTYRATLTRRTRPGRCG
jgi:hypothetical protein